MGQAPASAPPLAAPRKPHVSAVPSAQPHSPSTSPPHRHREIEAWAPPYRGAFGAAPREDGSSRSPERGLSLLFWGSPNLLAFPHPSILGCWPGARGHRCTGLWGWVSLNRTGTQSPDSQDAFEIAAGGWTQVTARPFLWSLLLRWTSNSEPQFPRKLYTYSQPNSSSLRRPMEHRGWDCSQKEAGPDDRLKPVWLLASGLKTPDALDSSPRVTHQRLSFPASLSHVCLWDVAPGAGPRPPALPDGVPR